MHDTPWQALQQRWLKVQATPAHEACASPCMSICVMKTDTDECWGCLRSLDEVAHWSVYSPSEQRSVWQRVSQRIQQHFAAP